MSADTGMNKVKRLIKRLIALFDSIVQLILNDHRSEEEIETLLDAMQRFKDGQLLPLPGLNASFMYSERGEHQRAFCRSFVGEQMVLRPWRHQLHQAGIYTIGELIQWPETTLVKTHKLPREAINAIKRVLARHQLTLGMKIFPPDCERLREDRVIAQNAIRMKAPDQQPAFKLVAARALRIMGVPTIGHFIRRVQNERENVISFFQSIDCSNPTLAAQEIIEYLTQYGFLEGAAYIPDGVTLPATDE